MPEQTLEVGLFEADSPEDVTDCLKNTDWRVSCCQITERTCAGLLTSQLNAAHIFLILFQPQI